MRPKEPFISIMPRLLLAAVAATGMLLGTSNSARAGWVYVGSWIVGDGPLWSTNPQAYSGQEAAAFLFGGAPLSYTISTIGSDPSDINHKTFLDGYGDTQYLTSPQSESFVGQTGSGYNQFPAYSAYVLDHTCSNRYVNAGSGCSGDGTQYVNYAFQEVPEPTSLVVLGAGLVGLSRVKRRSTP